MTDELLEQFVVEGRDLAEQASGALLVFETSGDPEAVDSALRAFHTLKGSTGLFDLAELGALLHTAEDRLEVIRRDPGLRSPESIGLLMESITEVERWLDGLAASGQPSDQDRMSAIRLRRTLADPDAKVISEEEDSTGAVPDWAMGLRRHAPAGRPTVAICYRPDAESYFRGEDPLALVRDAPGLIWLDLARPAAGQGGSPYSAFVCDLEIRALIDAPMAAARAAFRLAPDQVDFVQMASAQARDASGSVRTVRVAAARVDELAALADEVVIAKNAMVRAMLAAGIDTRTSEIRDGQAVLDRAIARIHEAVAGLRLAALTPVFLRLQRQARELSARLGKPAELVLSGSEVEVDKDVSEALFEPLLHLLRNALDHGVEPEADRLVAGKPARATLRLSAWTQGAEAIIEFADDGRGLDSDAIKAAAVSRALLSPDAAENLDDAAALELVFAPGFSTARQLSDVSGRGVGLDAVRAALARVGGTVSLSSQPGQGSVARLTVPLRAVMAKVAVVAANGQRYGAPLDSVREVVRLPTSRVSDFRAERAFLHRDEVLPLFSLSEAMGGDRPSADPLTVMVIGRGDEAFGVAVDAVVDRIEAPVRSPTGLLAKVPGVRGALVEPNGKVLMVLDLEELFA